MLETLLLLNLLSKKSDIKDGHNSKDGNSMKIKLQNYEMKSVTGLVVTIGITALMLYDLWCVYVGGVSSTVSDYLVNVVSLSPVTCVWLGYILCHLTSGVMFRKKEENK